MTWWPEGDLWSPHQTAQHAESKESPEMGKSEAGEELSMHRAQLWSDKFIKHCRLLTVSRRSGPVREEEQLPGQDRTAQALSESLSQRGNWRESTFQPLHLNSRQIGRKGLSAPRSCHPDNKPQPMRITGKCSMEIARGNEQGKVFLETLPKGESQICSQQFRCLLNKLLLRTAFPQQAFPSFGRTTPALQTNTTPSFGVQIIILFTLCFMKNSSKSIK